MNVYREKLKSNQYLQNALEGEKSLMAHNHLMEYSLFKIIYLFYLFLKYVLLLKECEGTHRHLHPLLLSGGCGEQQRGNFGGCCSTANSSNFYLNVFLYFEATHQI